MKIENMLHKFSCISLLFKPPSLNYWLAVTYGGVFSNVFSSYNAQKHFSMAMNGYFLSTAMYYYSSYMSDWINV